MTVANRSPAPTVQNLPDNRSSMSLISRSATSHNHVRWIRAKMAGLDGFRSWSVAKPAVAETGIADQSGTVGVVRLFRGYHGLCRLCRRA